jgi:hypothetical protein
LLTAEAIFAEGLMQTLALIELGLAVGSPMANSVIRSDQFANLFGGRDDPAYQEFVFWFSIFEMSANLAVAKVGIYSSISDAGLAANRLARKAPQYSVDHVVFSKLQQMSRKYGDMLWVDYPNVKRLVNEIGGLELAGDDILRLTPESLARLDADIASLGGDWYSNLKEPGGVAAYNILEEVGTWRMDAELLSRLAAKVDDSAALKLKLLEDGEDAVIAWRMVEDSRPTSFMWCTTFN